MSSRQAVKALDFDSSIVGSIPTCSTKRYCVAL
nr:MAG TPA: hypothetical protein [Bacteriophage sp.]